MKTRIELPKKGQGPTWAAASHDRGVRGQPEASADYQKLRAFCHRPVNRASTSISRGCDALA